MTQSAKKLAGTVLLVLLVIVYALVATAIAVARLSDSPGWVHALYFFLTGFLWVIPAMGIVSWMIRPSRKPQA